MDGRTRGIVTRGKLCCHCLLIESRHSLTLVDTGFGLRDVRAPHSRLSGFFLSLMSPEFKQEMTAAQQVEQLGFNRSDVRNIVLTHLDFDHAGGLDDFPDARVHLLAEESEYALLQKTWLDRQRFRPQQWSSRPRWQPCRAGAGESWFGFECVRELKGLPPEVLMIPLRGHTFGHAGVAVESEGRWLLMAGDAYFHEHEMDLRRPRCTPGLSLYQTMMDKSRRDRIANQARLRALKREHGAVMDVCSAHDTAEYERLAGRPVRVPAQLHASAVGGLF